MRYIREQWRSIEVGLNNILYALRGLVLPLAAWDSWALSTRLTQASQIPHDTWVALDADISAAECQPWMDCWLTGLRAVCKEDIQEIELWAKMSVEAELQVSGSRCAGCKCCWAAVVLLFSIFVHSATCSELQGTNRHFMGDVSYCSIHRASNSTINTTDCFLGHFKSRSNLSSLEHNLTQYTRGKQGRACIALRELRCWAVQCRDVTLLRKEVLVQWIPHLLKSWPSNGTKAPKIWNISKGRPNKLL